MEVVRIKKILARNLHIYISFHCVKRSSWIVTTLATLISSSKTKIKVCNYNCSYVIGVKTVEVLLAGKGLLLIWLNLLIRAESFLSCSAKFSDSKSLARSSSISVMYFVTMAVMSFSLVSPVLLSFIQLPTLKRNTKNKNLKNKINSNLNI